MLFMKIQKQLVEIGQIWHSCPLATYGRGEGVVVATAMETEIGKITKCSEDTEEMTPLQKELDELGKLLDLQLLYVPLYLLLYSRFI